MSPLTLTYSHNVIEHLGLKLYQNRPTRVIAELVSNAWDADSAKVWIDFQMSDAADRWIGVHDCGHGMTREELASNFLVIGAPKRVEPTSRSRKSRLFMGRKGIGKLAPFGIANIVDVVTCAIVAERPSLTWIRLNLANIKAGATPGAVAKYEPEIVLDQVGLDEALAVDDPTGQVKIFIDRIRDAPPSTGTLVLLTSLSIHRAISQGPLLESLGRRFTTMNAGFEMYVDGKKADTEVTLPVFELRIPEEGVITETVDGREVRSWVGFVKTPDWSQDEAGVGVYSHHKICQDRPFFFGIKGKEIFTRYMYAVVEADWLDEFKDDLISTDRTTINWDADGVQALHQWGAKKVGQWVSKFADSRRDPERKENRNLLREAIDQKVIPSLTNEEQEQVSDLLTEISPSLGKDEAAKKKLAVAVAGAWSQEPMRILVKELWSEVGKDDATVPDVFAGLIQKLVSYSVPESLNLAKVFAQRAFALTKLHEYVHHGKETDLQRLLVEFPWIIEPDSIYLTANQTLRTVVKQAEAKGQIPTGQRVDVVAGISITYKPDFVFLSSPDLKRIVVVELKNPQQDLTVENRAQLYDYMTFLEVHYPDAQLFGYLVGRVGAGTFKMPRNDSAVVPWTDIMQRARNRYVVFLAAMLSAVPPSAVPSVETVREFAGQEVIDLLNKLSLTQTSLSDAIAKYT